MGLESSEFGFLLIVLAIVLASSQSEEGFGYQDNSLGPGQWGCLATNFSTCRTGTQQSPINIKTRDAIDDCSLGKLRFHFSHSAGTLTSQKYLYRIGLDGDAENTVIIDGMEFRLVQFHFHHPSEHFIDGKKFELEAHLVYRAMDNSSRMAVVAQMYKKGEENSLLAQVLDMKNNVRTLLDLREFNLGQEYFRYIGSLTTPPCTQGVTWTILIKNKTASKQQIKDLKQCLGGRNARPLQRTNRREVYMYTFYQNFLAKY
ncbi:hypothetical protein SELMODRAFT_416362 [Selaginella moellendorffii]|uniref:Carbonic anhydrase n=1 Tax=Selaginella moellendorffii TaxID=88036 RepID=D8RZ19_SELML|nr:alpha carbonic anhydrase 7 [Selaginella moellendorffii]EFJ22531.1 hypothetical protein SELMODRAFT_416362 [Selaginella moellendorffii]|eukprot:XP_002976271.1 alpha carbonic anhydrase 7 [Selaginella moellendorffii]